MRRCEQQGYRPLRLRTEKLLLDPERKKSGTLGPASPMTDDVTRAGDGFMAQSSKWLHFGLGKATRVSQLVVRWPGGQAEEFTKGVQADGRYLLVQGAADAQPWEAPARTVVLRPSQVTPAADPGSTRTLLIHRVPLPRSIRPGEGWDIVFVDPPWGKEKAPPVVDAILGADRLADEGWIVMEERYGLEGTDDFWATRGLEVIERRHYGDSGVLMMSKFNAPDISET